MISFAIFDWFSTRERGFAHAAQFAWSVGHCNEHDCRFLRLTTCRHDDAVELRRCSRATVPQPPHLRRH